jgi:formate dehydrogenase iron-sulfur subunit
MSKGVLIDLTRCIGCRGCQVACKEWNQRAPIKTSMQGSYSNPPRLSAECYTRIRFLDHEKDQAPVWSYVKEQCLHCNHPACASSCPVAALTKTPGGPVVYDFDRCIGCRYCMVACPFQAPKYEWERGRPWVRKCTFCSERIKDDLLPACIQVCPTTAMFFGEYKHVLAEAKRRLKAKPGRYTGHIYGAEEAGGTSWIYISDEPFRDLGFNMNIPKISLPGLTWSSLKKIPLTAAGFVAFLSAVAYFRNRTTKDEG